MARSSLTYQNSAREVCIVGCGAVTALGYNATMTAASVRANLCRFKESHLVDKAGEPMLLSVAEFLEDEVRGMERLLALASPAIHEAMAPLARVSVPQAQLIEIPMYCGVASTRPGVDGDMGNSLVSRLVNEIPSLFQTQKRFGIALGHASALVGIEKAIGSIKAGMEEVVLVGGVDSYYDPDTLEWLDEMKRLHSEINKDGFIPGEGAGFCLLASADFASRHGLSPLAFVLSAFSAEEPHPVISDGVCIGQGLTNVLRQTLGDTTSEEKVADWTICDMNGESFRSREWVYAYLRTGKKHRDPLEIWHPADCYGDIGAASGAVLASIAIAAWQRNYARGKHALVWTSSDGKHRSAAVLKAPYTN